MSSVFGPGARCQLRTRSAVYDPCKIVSMSKESVTVEYKRWHVTEKGSRLKKHVETVRLSDVVRLREYQPGR